MGRCSSVGDPLNMSAQPDVPGTMVSAELADRATDPTRTGSGLPLTFLSLLSERVLTNFLCLHPFSSLRVFLTYPVSFNRSTGMLSLHYLTYPVSLQPL